MRTNPDLERKSLNVGVFPRDNRNNPRRRHCIGFHFSDFTLWSLSFLISLFKPSTKGKQYISSKYPLELNLSQESSSEFCVASDSGRIVVICEEPNDSRRKAWRPHPPLAARGWGGDKSVGEGTPGMMIDPLSLRADGLLAPWALKEE